MNVIAWIILIILVAWGDPQVQEVFDELPAELVLPTPVHDIAEAIGKAADAIGKVADAIPWAAFWLAITILLAPLVRVLAQYLADRLKKP